MASFKDLIVTGVARVTNTLRAGKFVGTAQLTGTPTAPTAASGTNTTQIATTAFVQTVANNTRKDGTLNNAAYLLSGYTAYGSNGTKYTGTMANKGAITGTYTVHAGESTTIQIPAGYHNGSGRFTIIGAN